MKLSDYVEQAAAEYVHETDSLVVDACWLAAFFQESGVLEAYPRQDVIAFHDLVQKTVDRNAERARKQALQHLHAVVRLAKKPPRSR